MDAYRDMAPFYDQTPLYRDLTDIRFYVREARRSGGPVLELGCGSGRILAPIAKAGIPIVGLDPSASMLKACRERLAREGLSARLVHGDMRNFRLGRKFKLITIPFRPFQHLLEVKDQMACLKAVRQHLVPGGRFIFDVFDPDLKQLTAKLGEVIKDAEFDLPDGRHVVRSFCRRQHDRIRQVLNVEIIHQVVGGRSYVSSLWIRYGFRWEMEHLLTRCGFKVERLYGDFNGNPVSKDTGNLVFVLTADQRR